MKYPITPEDFSAMHYRMATGQSCHIPVRQDVTMTDGTVVRNMLSWGSPLAYELYHEGGILYSRYKIRDYRMEEAQKALEETT